MNQIFLTNLIVCKGYEGKPALKFFGDNESCVQFSVAEKTYDAKAENNTRWVYYTVKAYGDACARIKKMQMKEGSLINILGGTLTEDVWTEGEGDKKTTKHMLYIKLEFRNNIEYVSGGGKKAANDSQAQSSSQNKDASATGNGSKNADQSDNFSGYEPFGDESFF